MDHALERTAADFLKSLPGGIAGKKLLAAVSGGADSIALIAILESLRDTLVFSLEAITVQHGIRTDGTSEGDANFAAELCASFNPSVPCFRVDLPSGAVQKEAERRGGGIEDAARFLRYAALQKRASDIGADWILTGHTENDFLETVLMRFLQGSGASALSGIHAVSGNLARPLLALTKADLVEYLINRGLTWREDPTNIDSRYLRNRLRSSLVPLLEEQFPGWKHGVKTSAFRLAQDDSLCRESFQFDWEKDIETGALKGSRAIFDSLHPAQAQRVLGAALNILSVGRRIPFAFLQRIVSERDTTRICGAGLRFEREGNLVFFGPDIVHYGKSGYLVYIDSVGIFDLPLAQVEVTGTPENAFIDGDFGPWRLPVILRSRMPGDRLEGDRAGLSLVKKTLNEWAVPETLRDCIPLVELNGELRAIFGRPFGYPDRIF